VTVCACLSGPVQIPAAGSVTLPSQGATSVNIAVGAVLREVNRVVGSVCPLPNRSGRGTAPMGTDDIYRYFSSRIGTIRDGTVTACGRGRGESVRAASGRVPRSALCETACLARSGAGRVRPFPEERSRSRRTLCCARRSEKGAPWTDRSSLRFVDRHHAQWRVGRSGSGLFGDCVCLLFQACADPCRRICDPSIAGCHVGEHRSRCRSPRGESRRRVRLPSPQPVQQGHRPHRGQ
jgi:hypothetical protein